MLSRGMSRTVSIIGAGRVGQTLGKRLRKLGWRIGAVVTRSQETSRAAVRSIGAGTPSSALSPEALDADVIFVTTPDGALETVAQALSRFRAKNYKNKIVLHTSGALDRSVLAPLARRGASTGSMHPMQTFSGREATCLEGVIFTIEGDRAALRAAAQIARSLGGIPIRIRGKDKPAYHAAGAFVAGHGLALVEAATQTLAKIGFSHRRALEALLPLIRQMLDNYERLGPYAAWTGPVSRGDYATVAKHGRALRRYPPEFGDTYRALALLAARVLSKHPAATRKQIVRALKNSRGGTV
jgi:predicted short-subunit dehydrogenase-like oxidoreductase (DUF2520 family)